MDKLFLIDGHALIFKMYYAFLRRPMINSKGMDTSILYGFTKYILELIQRENPTHFAVAFDPPGGTFRNKMYPEYKANRTETPQLVIDALDPLTEICHALNIPVLMTMGYEADDVIGTIAKRLGSEKMSVYMVTPDKDYGQLIDDYIFQVRPAKGDKGDEILDKAAICEKYGINEPDQVIEILTLCGDTADNVPGVKGIGEVGAGKLISKYGTVKNIYDHIDELTARQQDMFKEAEDHIELSHELVTINTKVPIEVPVETMVINKVYGTEVADLFEKYEFNSLKKFIGNIKPTVQKKTEEVVEVGKEDVIAAAIESGKVSFVTTSQEGQGFFVGISEITFCASDGDRCLTASGMPEDFKSIMESAEIEKIGYDIKKQLNILRYNGFAMEGKLLDVQLMHYLVNPEQSHDLEILAKNYLGWSIEEQPSEMLFDSPSQNCGTIAAAELLLSEKVLTEMTGSGVNLLYDHIEEPLIRVLAKMEFEGVKMDLAVLKDYTASLRKEVSGIEAEIREIAGNPGLNVSSPKQIGELIYEQLGLDPKARKKANGSWATDETTLRKIADRHPVINKILAFRSAKKLLSTYIEPFPDYISPETGKIHTTFNQATTATGRLSSANPNLQNIPIRSDRGREIRKAFIASKPDGVIMSADYSQIELRIMAHLSGDAHMIKAFQDGMDIHAVTASKIYGIPVEDVTPNMRRIAKSANFGIIYGISSFGLAENLGTSRGEAQKIIDDYFEAFPTVKTFIGKMEQDAREKGFVETIFGRRRYLPDINNKSVTLRNLAERNAVNAPIQGTAADIIKLAMIGVQKKLEESGLKSKMVLQIHDELLFDGPESEAEDLKKLVVDQMENVISLTVPLTVECNYGKNWLEAH